MRRVSSVSTYMLSMMITAAMPTYAFAVTSASTSIAKPVIEQLPAPIQSFGGKIGSSISDDGAEHTTPIKGQIDTANNPVTITLPAPGEVKTLSNGYNVDADGLIRSGDKVVARLHNDGALTQLNGQPLSDANMATVMGAFGIKPQTIASNPTPATGFTGSSGGVNPFEIGFDNTKNISAPGSRNALEMFFGGGFYRDVARAIGGESSDPWNAQIAEWQKEYDAIKVYNPSGSNSKYNLAEIEAWRKNISDVLSGAKPSAFKPENADGKTPYNGPDNRVFTKPAVPEGWANLLNGNPSASFSTGAVTPAQHDMPTINPAIGLNGAISTTTNDIKTAATDQLTSALPGFTTGKDAQKDVGLSAGELPISADEVNKDLSAELKSLSRKASGVGGTDQQLNSNPIKVNIGLSGSNPSTNGTTPGSAAAGTDLAALDRIRAKVRSCGLTDHSNEADFSTQKFVASSHPDAACRAAYEQLNNPAMRAYTGGSTSIGSIGGLTVYSTDKPNTYMVPVDGVNRTITATNGDDLKAQVEQLQLNSKSAKEKATKLAEEARNYNDLLEAERRHETGFSSEQYKRAHDELPIIEKRLTELYGTPTIVLPTNGMSRTAQVVRVKDLTPWSSGVMADGTKLDIYVVSNGSGPNSASETFVYLNGERKVMPQAGYTAGSVGVGEWLKEIGVKFKS